MTHLPCSTTESVPRPHPDAVHARRKALYTRVLGANPAARISASTSSPTCTPLTRPVAASLATTSNLVRGEGRGVSD